MSQTPQPPPGLAPPPGLRQPQAPGLPGSVSVPTGRASFGQRLGAYVIDLIVLFAIGFVVGLFFGLAGGGAGLVNGINFLLGVAYIVYFHGSPSGQTVGKKAVKIRVVGSDDGAPIGYVRAALRYVGSILSFIVLLMGYFWMLWDDNKQTWHDKIASTIVVPESDAPVAKWPG